MDREEEHIPGSTTQAPNPSEKEMGMWWLPLSPPDLELHPPCRGGSQGCS